MSANPILVKMLSEKAGRDVTTPSGADFLRNDIHTATGEPISINTIKRLVGILDYKGNHRLQLLNIIAKYLGYTSWSVLDEVLNQGISDFTTHNPFLELESLPKDQKIEIQWEPDRRLVIRHIEDRLYEVTDCRNAKLQAGDILTLYQIGVGFPFYAKDVKRDGRSLSNYTAANITGISKIKIL